MVLPSLTIGCMRVVQLLHRDHGRRVAVVAEPWLQLLQDCASVYDLARSAIQSNRSLRAGIEQLASGEQLNYDVVYGGRSDPHGGTGQWRLLSPIDHPEPGRCFVTGTGLTHKAS